MVAAMIAHRIADQPGRLNRERRIVLQLESLGVVPCENTRRVLTVAANVRRISASTLRQWALAPLWRALRVRAGKSRRNSFVNE